MAAAISSQAQPPAAFSRSPGRPGRGSWPRRPPCCWWWSGGCTNGGGRAEMTWAYQHVAWEEPLWLVGLVGGGGAGLFLPTAAWCDSGRRSEWPRCWCGCCWSLALLGALADPRAIYKVDDHYFVVAIDGSHSITAPALPQNRSIPGRPLSRPGSPATAAWLTPPLPASWPPWPAGRRAENTRLAGMRKAKQPLRPSIRMFGSACRATACGKACC